MRLKRTRADHWFSLCVRERANFICEYCQVDFRSTPNLLDCSHFIGRSSQSTRYHPLNAFAHCSESANGCHAKLGGGRFRSGNPAEFSEHYDNVFGSINREVMRSMSSSPFRHHSQHIKMISDYYRPIYKEMCKKRENGELGRIEFDFYAGSRELLALEKDIRSRL